VSATRRATTAASTPPRPPGVGVTPASVLAGTMNNTSSGSSGTPSALPARYSGAAKNTQPVYAKTSVYTRVRGCSAMTSRRR
jgi:hypothetical protein